jgi:hypothetical protein
MGAVIATVFFLFLGVMLWWDGALLASAAALGGTAFCLVIALGLVKTRRDKRW